MEEVSFTLVQRRATPIMQLALALAVGWLGMLVVTLNHMVGGYEYFAAFLAIILYCIINTVVSIANDSFFKYTVPSYYLYILLVVVLFLSAKFLSGISIWDLWEYRMMIVSITLFYFTVSTLIRGVRFLFDVASKEE